MPSTIEYEISRIPPSALKELLGGLEESDPTQQIHGLVDELKISIASFERSISSNVQGLEKTVTNMFQVIPKDIEGIVENTLGQRVDRLMEDRGKVNETLSDLSKQIRSSPSKSAQSIPLRGRSFAFPVFLLFACSFILNIFFWHQNQTASSWEKSQEGVLARKLMRLNTKRLLECSKQKLDKSCSIVLK
jgi:hypothetical protein